jgi:hypothetical protein
MGIEDIIGAEVWAALDRAECRRLAVRRMRWAFEMRIVHHRRYCWLGIPYSGNLVATLSLEGAPVPWGWAARHEHARDVVTVMPLWLYWPIVAWERLWLVFPLLRRLGLWRVDKEVGHWWADGHPTAPRWWRAFWWCFLNDADRAPERITFLSPVQRHAFTTWAERELRRRAEWLRKWYE